MTKDLKHCQQEIWWGKVLCVFFSLVHTLLAHLLPSLASLFHLMLLVTLIHLFFFLWVTCASDSQKMLDRYSKVDMISAMSSVIVLSFAGQSPTILAKGVAYCIGPFTALKNCTSSERVLTYCALHFAGVLYNSKTSIWKADEDVQWVILAIITYSVAFDIHRKNSNLHQSSMMLQSAYEVFQKMLAAMCDGYLALDADGCVIGLDTKASTIIVADVKTQRIPFVSLLHHSSAAGTSQMKPGLEKVHLTSFEGQVLEVECYTCDCNISPDKLSIVLGTGSCLFQHPSSGSSANSIKCVTALRVVNQVPSMGRSMENQHIVVNRRGQGRMPMHDGSAGSAPGLPTSPQEPPCSSSGASQSSSSTGGSSKGHLNLGARVNLVRTLLEDGSRQLLAMGSTRDVPKQLMLLRKSFKHLICDAIDQTEEQMSFLLSTGQFDIISEEADQGRLQEDGSQEAGL